MLASNAGCQPSVGFRHDHRSYDHHDRHDHHQVLGELLREFLVSFSQSLPPVIFINIPGWRVGGWSGGHCEGVDNFRRPT